MSAAVAAMPGARILAVGSAAEAEAFVKPGITVVHDVRGVLHESTIPAVEIHGR